MTNAPTIGMQIQAIRLDLGLSQKDFAKLLNERAPGLGASQPQVSAWELDQTKPHAATLYLIRRLHEDSLQPIPNHRPQEASQDAANEHAPTSCHE